MEDESNSGYNLKIPFNESLFDIKPASMKVFKEAVLTWLNIMLDQGLKKTLQKQKQKNGE